MSTEKLTLPTGGSALPPGATHETKFVKASDKILTPSDVPDDVIKRIAGEWWKEHGLDVQMIFLQTSLGRPTNCLRSHMGRLGLSSSFNDQRLGTELDRLMMASLRG